MSSKASAAQPISSAMLLMTEMPLACRARLRLAPSHFEVSTSPLDVMSFALSRLSSMAFTASPFLVGSGLSIQFWMFEITIGIELVNWLISLDSVGLLFKPLVTAAPSVTLDSSAVLVGLSAVVGSGLPEGVLP